MKRVILIIVLIVSGVNLSSGQILEQKVIGKWSMKRGTILLTINFKEKGVFEQRVNDPSRSKFKVTIRTGKWKIFNNYIVLIYMYRKKLKKFVFKYQNINGSAMLLHSKYRLFLRKSENG